MNMNKRRYSDEERKQRKIEYNRTHKEQINQQHRLYTLKHPEKVREWQKRYYQTHDYYREHKDVLNAKARQRKKQQREYILNMSDDEYLVYFGLKQPKQSEQQ